MRPDNILRIPKHEFTKAIESQSRAIAKCADCMEETNKLLERLTVAMNAINKLLARMGNNA